MNTQKTKIICTIGPASSSEKILRRLIENGMNVARLNFSHGTKKEHENRIKIIRRISNELGCHIGILQDLCGPKIRVGEVPEPGILLKAGGNFILTTEKVKASEEMVSVSHQNLSREVKPKDRILLADGMLELDVNKINGNNIFCTVITGGILTSHKGINLPTSSIKTESVTKKDIEDLLFGLKHGVDYIALSFVRSADDILKVKKIIQKEKKNTPVIAKIEKHEVLSNIDKVIEVSDGIMVARGDLGVEIPLEFVPGIQKMLIKKANSLGKPVIIATQMLRSMVDSTRPTRAEATDVANAVFEGADALMLSEETASGRFPVQALQFMGKIAHHAEEDFHFDKYLKFPPNPEISESVAHASCVLADHLGASAIIATTQSGFTAQQVSKFRPKAKVIAISPDPETLRRLSIHWGCIPVYIKKTENTDEMFENALSVAFKSGYVLKGDKVVITAGHPLWVAGTTNMIQVKTL
jgi:pyruvate kinase